MRTLCGTILAAALSFEELAQGASDGLHAYSMVTRDGRRLVSHMEGTNTVYELVPTS